MAAQAHGESLLDDLRVLDLADEKGVYCSRILADLGADVIRIERPGGDAMRSNGPFYHDIPHPERSLYFWQFNANKRGVTLNLETADGRAIFRRLIEKADIVVESFPPGYLDSLGLGYEALARVNPELIMTSISPFGQSGPYRDFQGSDIVGVAMGGMMNVCGYPETPPVMPFGEQAYHTASSYAAIASLIALNYRDIAGAGQYIDVPVQSCVAFSLEFANLWYIHWNEVLGRRGSAHGSSGVGAFTPNVYACQDGHMCTFPGHIPEDWIAADDMLGDLNEPQWQDPFTKLTPECQAHKMEITAAWMKTHTKAELFEGCQNMHISWSPVNTFADLFPDPHLKERGFFVPLEHPELGETLPYPGAPMKMQETPWRLRRRAPLVGEHNLEIYGQELGFTKEQLSLLAEGGVI
jgi:benzylsuccinate CoA-transferase BbsE subunit